MTITCNNHDGRCSQCGKPAVAWVRTCRAVVPLPTVRPKVAAALPTMFDELPCAKRSNVRDEEMPTGCCGGATALVEIADCPRGRCTMRGIGGTVACLRCEVRE